MVNKELVHNTAFLVAVIAIATWDLTSDKPKLPALIKDSFGSTINNVFKGGQINV